MVKFRHLNLSKESNVEFYFFSFVQQQQHPNSIPSLTLVSVLCLFATKSLTTSANTNFNNQSFYIL